MVLNVVQIKKNLLVNVDQNSSYMNKTTPYYCGLGLRNEFINEVDNHNFKPSWFEVVPENWMDINIKNRRAFERIVSEHEIVAHGLSLSIGSNTPLDKSYLKKLKTFLDDYEIKHYSEHLSFCSLDNKQLYELLPVPMTMKMVKYISERVDEVQNFLGRSVALENASYYYVPYAEMSESDFINEVISQSGCKLLFDVNNVYVNAHNHLFDAKDFIDKIDLSKIAYMHVAGHHEVSDALYIDTHGDDVKDEVWDLLKYVKDQGVDKPLLLERDNDVPSYEKLLKEYQYMQKIYS